MSAASVLCPRRPVRSTAGETSFLRASRHASVDDYGQSSGTGPTSRERGRDGLALVVSTLVAAVPLVLVGPGVYVALRLFLVTPAVMLDGHGPGRALARSWDPMGGSVLATLVAMVGVLAAGLAVAAPLAVVVGSELVASAVAVAVVGPLAVGAQVSLYVEFTGGT